jgi:prevent-host-death family protein
MPILHPVACCPAIRRFRIIIRRHHRIPVAAERLQSMSAEDQKDKTKTTVELSAGPAGGGCKDGARAGRVAVSGVVGRIGGILPDGTAVPAAERRSIDTLLNNVHYDAHQCTGDAMQEATFTELRNHAKDYFDAVEGGDTVRIFRNGKPIAEIVPIRSGIPSWKRQATPLTVKGLSLSREILSDRDDAA